MNADKTTVLGVSVLIGVHPRSSAANNLPSQKWGKLIIP
jgi:hypothetical protein